MAACAASARQFAAWMPGAQPSSRPPSRFSSDVAVFSSAAQAVKKTSLLPGAKPSGAARTGARVPPGAIALNSTGGANTRTRFRVASARISSIVSKNCGRSSWPGTLITFRPTGMRVAAPLSRVKANCVVVASPARRW